MGLFKIGFCELFVQDWLWTGILTSTYWASRIIDMSHQHWAQFFNPLYHTITLYHTIRRIKILILYLYIHIYIYIYWFWWNEDKKTLFYGTTMWQFVNYMCLIQTALPIQQQPSHRVINILILDTFQFSAIKIIIYLFFVLS
jgi:hypothetical protein